jgi:hypothetical protein
VQDFVEADSNRKARLLIRKRHSLQWVPNGTVVAEVSMPGMNLDGWSPIAMFRLAELAEHMFDRMKAAVVYSTAAAAPHRCDISADARAGMIDELTRQLALFNPSAAKATEAGHWTGNDTDALGYRAIDLEEGEA